LKIDRVRFILSIAIYIVQLIAIVFRKRLGPNYAFDLLLISTLATNLFIFRPIRRRDLQSRSMERASESDS